MCLEGTCSRAVLLVSSLCSPARAAHRAIRLLASRDMRITWSLHKLTDAKHRQASFQSMADASIGKAFNSLAGGRQGVRLIKTRTDEDRSSKPEAFMFALLAVLRHVQQTACFKISCVHDGEGHLTGGKARQLAEDPQLLFSCVCDRRPPPPPLFP